MEYTELIGKTFKFYGVYGTSFKLDKNIYEAIEDESDGYRSMMATLYDHGKDASWAIFQPRPIATVRVEEAAGSIEGIQLVDVKDGHIWLVAGTDTYYDWYPMFIFEYAAKPAPAIEKNDWPHVL